MAAAYCDFSAAADDDDDDLEEEEGCCVAAAAAPLGNGKRTVGCTEKQRRRRRVDVAQWSDSAVRMLVGVLRLLRFNRTFDESEGLVVGDKSNKQIWKWVARALQMRGHNFDAVQCKTKFKGLKAEYHATGLVESPECWLEIPDELRDKASKFKFFSDMRDYFLGSPVIHSDGLFEGQTPEEFLQCLRTEAYACQPKAPKRKNPTRPADVATEPCFQPPIQLDRYHHRKEEHRAKKLQIAEKKLQLAEQKLQLELIRAENQRQKLENESRKIDLEERRMKLHEEQLLSTNNILNSVLGCCLSHKNNAIFQ